MEKHESAIRLWRRRVGALAVIASLGLLLLFECWLDGQQRRRAEEAALIRDRMARIRRGRIPVRLIAE
jgi:hypothetical protein